MFGPEEVQLADNSACASIRADLKMCLLNSDCCKVVSFITWSEFTKYLKKSYNFHVFRIKRPQDNA